MVLSITLHIWDIKLHWSSPLKYYWTTNFHILYSLHRGGKYIFNHILNTHIIFYNFFYI